jgi:hypothetical protein
VTDATPDAAEGSPWDGFIFWAEQFRSSVGSLEREYNYKLEVAENLRAARSAIEQDAENRYLTLRRSFGSPSNLVYPIVQAQFLDWVGANLEAMAVLWGVSNSPGPRGHWAGKPTHAPGQQGDMPGKAQVGVCGASFVGADR